MTHNVKERNQTMKDILSGKRNYILFFIFICLLLILWGRIVIREMKAETYKKNLTTLEKRIRCVESFGWKIDHGSELSENLRLPDKFDEIYTNYNNFLKSYGFDLSDYCGKVITKYTYIITNPPTNSNDIFYATLLTYEDNMIGGDVFSPSLNGVMLPIKRLKE